MRNFILISYLILHGLSLPLVEVCAQNSVKTDSLSQLLAETSNDSTKAQLLHELFWEYRRNDIEKALEYAEQSLELSLSIADNLGIASSYYEIGVVMKSQGNYREANTILHKASGYFQSEMDTFGVIACYTDIGNIHYKQNEYEKAFEYLDEARSLALLVGDKARLSRIYSLLGGICMTLKQFDKSLNYHGLSLEINTEQAHKLGMSVNYNNIGNVFFRLHKYEKSKENYSKSIEIKSGINDIVGMASIFNNLALISAKLEDYSQAINYHNQALVQFLEMNNIVGITASYINLANVFLLSNNPKQSIEIGLKGDQLAIEYGLMEKKAEISRILSAAYEKLGQYKEANKHQKLYKTYNDSVQSQELVSQIDAMESKLEVEKKENEIALLNADREKQELKIKSQEMQKKMMIVFIVLVLFVLLALMLGYRNKQKLNRKLRELNLSRSRFFANISHEFRTPLTLLLGPIEKLLAKPEQDEKEMINMMHRNAARLLVLDNQLLELSKLESGNLKLKVSRSDINLALKGMVSSFQSLAEKRLIDFKYHFPDKEILAYFDQDKLEKIVYNLLSNALKFTPENEVVLFELSLLDNKSNIELASGIKKMSGAIISITIIDKGPGIAKEHLSHIFDRFYQVDVKQNRKFEGTGLGLSLSKELVELHHGSIQVESKPDMGSTFRVFLPIEKQAYRQNEIVDFSQKSDNETGQNEGRISLSEPIEESQATDSSTEDKIQMLIVEDNPEMRAYITDYFKTSYSVVEAVDGKAGFDSAINIMPDIIISDLMMPVMDGIELCRKLKEDERTSHIPVILLSALAAIEDRIKGLETGADDYVAKPFNHAELQVRVQNLIDQRKVLFERFSNEIRLEASDIAASSVDVKFIDKLISIVERNMADPDLGVDQLTEELYLSRSQLHRKLKALTGQSATEFIRSIRLKRAARLFEQNTGSISETIYAVGFNNLSYFTRCFQRQFSLTPREYMKQFADKK